MTAQSTSPTSNVISRSIDALAGKVAYQPSTVLSLKSLSKFPVILSSPTRACELRLG
jgi:hypothetical protein